MINFDYFVGQGEAIIETVSLTAQILHVSMRLFAVLPLMSTTLSTKGIFHA
jgi:hypothetical protein